MSEGAGLGAQNQQQPTGQPIYGGLTKPNLPNSGGGIIGGGPSTSQPIYGGMTPIQMPQNPMRTMPTGPSGNTGSPNLQTNPAQILPQTGVSGYQTGTPPPAGATPQMSQLPQQSPQQMPGMPTGLPQQPMGMGSPLGMPGMPTGLPQQPGFGTQNFTGGVPSSQPISGGMQQPNYHIGQQGK